ncbi:unnamed protein product [Phaeothamnion confervicola]
MQQSGGDGAATGGADAGAQRRRRGIRRCALPGGRTGGPKKNLVAAVVRRHTIFMLGEFWTSKICPGGCGGEMVDVQGEFRVRRCNKETAIKGLNSAAVCPRFSLGAGSPGVAFTCDR